MAVRRKHKGENLAAATPKATTRHCATTVAEKGLVQERNSMVPGCAHINLPCNVYKVARPFTKIIAVLDTD
eukprot:12911094-Prorocentrum_lima.AAC.1